MKNKCVLCLFLVTGLLSCKKFLDVQPKGYLIPQKVADYESILNSPTLTLTFPANLHDFTDDIYRPLTAADQSVTANAYYWLPILTVDPQAPPAIWGSTYHAIYDTNIIINGVLNANDGTEMQKKSVLGEALVMRADIYLDLLTVFAKAYNPATAGTDPGLPLVTSTNVGEDIVPARSSVQATLNALIADVNQAAELLPETNINRYRVTRYVAYGLLSRLYLYMADFANAKKYTSLALQAPHTLLNYNAYTASTNFPVYELSPEVLWQRSGQSPRALIYSDDLKSYFNSSDLRYQFLTGTTGGYVTRNVFPGQYNFGITFPELYLTQAELLAREGKTADAMALVNLIRKNRIKTANYADQTATDSEDALVKVLAERRRELAFSGLRWFDMKRLDQEGRMPKIQRINVTTKAVEATLAPHSPNYTFEIPIRVSLFNPDMQLNFK